MSYQPTHFDQIPAGLVLEKDEARQIEPYVFTEDIVIAVDVALATGRPLLVSGNPGCGKSQLADAIAAVQGWSLLRKTITSRTRPESLTVEVDQLRRLNDAQAGAGLKPESYYLNPGVFWWAFQPRTARRRGLAAAEAKQHTVRLSYPGVERRGGAEPAQNQEAGGALPAGKSPAETAQCTVLLIDEIDKAEPDLPNDLLEPLDRRRFDLPDGYRVRGQARIAAAAGSRLLTVITTNGERDLPQAFIRRCVLLKLPDPEAPQLVAIARQHFPQGDAERMGKIAGLLGGFREKAKDERRRPPGTSEFLDAVAACEDLQIVVSDDKDSVWKKIEGAVLEKDAGS